jgi:hypothetical protein
VTEFILLETPKLDVTPSSDFINLENGILDAGELLPRSAKVLSTIRILLAKRASAGAGFPKARLVRHSVIFVTCAPIRAIRSAAGWRRTKRLRP